MSAYVPVRLTSGGIRDCFEPGNIVSCTTCYDKVIKGEVLAFDAYKKLLVIKQSSNSGDPTTNNLDIINLSFVKHVEMAKDTRNTPKKLDRISTVKLHSKVKRAMEEKKRVINAMSGGVDVDGQQLFLTINRTIKEIYWRDQDIVVYDDAQIVITPPYRADNIKGNVDGKAYKHIRKVVEKHFADLEKVNRSNNGNNNSNSNNNNNNNNNNSSSNSNSNNSNSNNSNSNSNSNNSNSNSNNNSNNSNSNSSNNNNINNNSNKSGGKESGSSSKPVTGSNKRRNKEEDCTMYNGTSSSK